MWLISVLILVPVCYLALGRELPVELADRLKEVFPQDQVPTSQALAIAFVGGLFIGGTPFHSIFRYLATVVHELGHAFTAGILGGRPKNITIAPSASGLATYQPPIGWGRGRASLVSFAGYPAPAIASLAAVRSLQQGQTVSWFFFATGTLAIAIVFLIRNWWGFFWTAAASTGAYFAATNLPIQTLGWIIAGIAGYLAMEGYRHSWQQVQIIKRMPGVGCDAEHIAYWWKQNPRFIGSLHLIFVTGIGIYSSYLAINPYWNEIFDWFKQLTETS
jgi:hypothetical protein